MKSKRVVLKLLVFIASLGVHADVTLPVIFKDHQILQRGVANTVWGSAAPNEGVTVTFKGQVKTATADADGNWHVQLDPMEASSDPAELTVKGSNLIVLKDVLVGEVWLASGQSNMVSGIKQVPGDQRKVFVDQKDNTRIRCFIKDKWYLLSEQALSTSAVGFFFANKLEKALDVPVAYLVVAQLGSKIEPFVPPAEAKAASLGNKASGIFTTRVEPLAKYSIKGVIWYQGESNSGSTNYFECLKALHAGWSRVFGIPELPFYQVQIAPYSKAETRTSRISDSVWIAQYRAAKEIPGMGIVPLHDTGISVKQIHPRSKQPVGERLAALALKNQYGKNVVTTGPVFAKAERKGNSVVVTFDRVDQGLVTSDGKAPSFFEVSADGKTFVDATATLKGNQVEASAPGVDEPEFVRMGWYDTAIPNLKDKNGWPVWAFPAKGVE